MAFRMSVPLIALGFLAVHTALALWLPLVDDEAYYALWATEPALGYYDHPPMVAWWIAAGTALLGETTLGVRLISLLAFAATTLLVGRIGEIYAQDAKAGVVAALLFNLTLPVFGLGFVATPDAPLLLFWTAAIWALLNLKSGKDPRWWLGFGLLAALAVQSKFTGLFLGLGVVLWVLSTRSGLGNLTGKNFWFAGVIALLTLTPLVFWNYSNDWIGLERQFGRIGAEGETLDSLWEFLVTTPLLMTPLVFLFAILGVMRRSDHRAVLLIVHMPMVVFMVQHSLGVRVQGNWLLPIYPWAAVLASIWLTRKRKIWRDLTAASAAALSISVLFLGLKPGPGVFPGDNPLNQTKGWESASTALRAETRDFAWVATVEYSTTGRMAWVLGAERVWSVARPERYLFRNPFPAVNCSAPGVLIERADRQNAAANYFETVGTPKTLTRISSRAVLETYRLTPVSEPRAINGC